MSEVNEDQQWQELPYPHADLLMPHHAAPRAASPRARDHRCRSSVYHVADQGADPTSTSRLLHILRKWRLQCRKPNRHPDPVRASRSPTRSPSCSMLNLVPLSCIPFSAGSFQLEQQSDHLAGDGDDDYITDDSHHMNAGSGSHLGDAQLQHRPSPAHSPNHLQTYSAHAAGSTCKPALTKIKSSTGWISEERGPASPCEKKLQAPARRALSCPMLGSPLRSCTAFADIQEEELECLRTSKEEDDDHRRQNNLRRTASSPSPRRSRKSSAPKGYLALYVGQERQRFLVKANVLNHPLFNILLEKAREEFGFTQKGPLNIPCDVAFFQHIMFLVQSNDPSCKINADDSSVLLKFPSSDQIAMPVV